MYHLLFLKIILILSWTLTERNTISRNSRPDEFCEKDVFKNFAIFTGKHLYWSFFKKKLQETPTQMFSCENCEIFKNNFFEEHLLMAASVFCKTYIPLVTTFTTNNTHITILYSCNCFYQKFARFLTVNTAQKLKFSIKDFFSKCGHIY